MTSPYFLTLKQAEEMLAKLENAAQQVGLEINENKTEIVNINPDSDYQVKSTTGKHIKITSNFKYLGSQIPDSFTDFKYRKAQAWDAMNKLDKVWKSRITRKVKIRFFQACVESILLYGSETWTVSAELKARIDGCYTRLLRRALN